MFVRDLSGDWRGSTEKSISEFNRGHRRALLAILVSLRLSKISDVGRLNSWDGQRDK